MNSREHVVFLLDEVAKFQDAYIDVQDILFNQKFGAKISYDGLLEATQQVLQVLIALHQVISEEEGRSQDVPKKYIEEIREYISALFHAVELLKGIL
jgi:hypothetical protein